MAPTENQPVDGEPSNDRSPANRKRRYHKRSRDGCVTCRARHVKCDESRPVCTQCLVHGRRCHYGSQMATPSVIESSIVEIFSATPEDPFNALPVQMVASSPQVLHEYLHNRELVRGTLPKGPYAHISGLPTGMEDPVFFRSAMILSVAHLRFLHGASQELERTNLTHKVVVINAIKEQLKRFSTSISEYYVPIMSVLFKIEFAAGDIDAAEAHLQGLFSLIEMNKDPHISQLDARITLFYFCFLRKAQEMGPVGKDYNATQSWTPRSQDYVTAAFIHLHLIHEFNIEPNRSILKRGNDTELICWLYGSLQAEHKATASIGEDRELWAWRTAVGAYVLGVGTLWPSGGENAMYSEPDEKLAGLVSARNGSVGMDKGKEIEKETISLGTKQQRPATDKQRCLRAEKEVTEPRTKRREIPDLKAPTRLNQPKNGVHELRVWIEEMMRDWRCSKRMVTWKNIDPVLDKIQWLKTTEGLEVLRQVYLESRTGAQ